MALRNAKTASLTRTTIKEGEDDVTRYCFHDARRLASSQAVCQL